MRLNLLASRRLRLALGVLAIALPATADSPTNPPQYQQFDPASPEIVDVFTTLHWDRRRVMALPRNGPGGADLYCNSTVFPGSGRVPSVKELLTLVDESPHAEYDSSFKPPTIAKSIDQPAFPNQPTKVAYWSSTAAPIAGEFWTVEFTSGKTKPMPAATVLNVRCVH